VLGGGGGSCGCHRRVGAIRQAGAAKLRAARSPREKDDVWWLSTKPRNGDRRRRRHIEGTERRGRGHDGGAGPPRPNAGPSPSFADHHGRQLRTRPNGSVAEGSVSFVDGLSPIGR